MYILWVVFPEMTKIYFDVYKSIYKCFASLQWRLYFHSLKDRMFQSSLCLMEHLTNGAKTKLFYLRVGFVLLIFVRNSCTIPKEFSYFPECLTVGVFD